MAVERTWQPIDDSPLSRRPGRAAVWTGAEMLIWGGAFLCANDRCDEEIAQPASDGAAYASTPDRWRPVAASPLAARDRPAMVSAGNQVLIWGGSAGRHFFGDGAVYVPAADRWEPMPESPLRPRGGVSGVWTGRELLLWGGSAGAQFFADGAV
ncbi:MAG TPA: hypothetical protein VM264_09515, partial [Acidimicrobiales bacterium]|nr:hypothetical protein [Acidimicrobiales bacterium]